MPSPTYVALAKTVLTGTQATVTFSGISNDYTDLVLLISARNPDTGVVGNLNVQINGDTASNYSRTRMYGFGSTAYSERNSNAASFTDAAFVTSASATSNSFANVELYIPNYTGSTNKVISGSSSVENNSTTENAVAAHAYLYRGTSAITSIALSFSLGFVSGSRFDLYGIKNS